MKSPLTPQQSTQDSTSTAFKLTFQQTINFKISNQESSFKSFQTPHHAYDTQSKTLSKLLINS